MAQTESERLRELLQELHEALESAEPIDPTLHAPLQGAMEEIGRSLDPTHDEGAAARKHHSLSSRISELALEFEADHPTIAGTLNRLTHMLSNMGI